MSRIAIVGAGISGLTAAYYLRKLHDLTLFEAADYIGGHTNTIPVARPGGPDDLVDTGFIVFNDWTYPRFIRLLNELGVASRPTEMSFSVTCERTGLEYAGNTLNSLFAQRRNIVRPSFHRMLYDVVRFYRRAPALLRGAGPGPSLREYLHAGRYSREFIDQHIIPMGAAIWSANPGEFTDIPARFFVQFFVNHGMLNLFRRPVWRTIVGGSQAYIPPLTAAFRDRIRLSCPVLAVERGVAGVDVTHAGGRERFDSVILALHSDQALRILADPSPAEHAILGAVGYLANETVLHTDISRMPSRRRAWASWNYRLPAQPDQRPTLTYNMNILQGLSTPSTYLVSLNQSGAIDPRAILRTLEYHHPVFTPAAVAAQQRWREISGTNRTYYCGAYWGYGFHEDGVASGLAVADQLKNP